jgi:hypothetical protein
VLCVVVADDHGARCASHALRGAGWGHVHFEAKPDAALRLASAGKPVVLNTSRADEADVAAALTEMGAGAYDWRTPPPELSEEEWSVLYDRTDALTPQKIKRRLASATEKLGDAGFDRWRLPKP